MNATQRNDPPRLPDYARAKLVNWLQDAHAIEGAVERALVSHLRDAANYPEVQEQLVRHLEETRSHLERVEQALAALGAKPAVIESAVGRLLGTMQASASAFLGDKVVTNAAADYATEHLEMATYAAIQAAAEEYGADRVAETCRTILREEEDMARWLGDHLPTLTREYLQKWRSGFRA